jgi:hypothetical protein
MWTGEAGDSLFEEGWIDLPKGTRGDSVGEPVRVPCRGDCRQGGGDECLR